MGLVLGTRKVRIKRINDSGTKCSNCNSFDIRYEIFREYYHVYWIPIFPLGDNEVKAICNKCGQHNTSSPRVKHFELITRAPIYLFSAPLLALSLILTVVCAKMITNVKNEELIANPKVGDVYLMHKKLNDSTFYYFQKVAGIKQDTIVVYPNLFEYFKFVSKMDSNDFFITQEILYTKTELRKLFENGNINTVERNYGDEEGFNKLKIWKEDSLK